MNKSEYESFSEWDNKNGMVSGRFDLLKKAYRRQGWLARARRCLTTEHKASIIDSLFLTECVELLKDDEPPRTGDVGVTDEYALLGGEYHALAYWDDNAKSWWQPSKSEDTGLFFAERTQDKVRIVLRNGKPCIYISQIKENLEDRIWFSWELYFEKKGVK